MNTNRGRYTKKLSLQLCWAAMDLSSYQRPCNSTQTFLNWACFYPVLRVLLLVLKTTTTTLSLWSSRSTVPSGESCHHCWDYGNRKAEPRPPRIGFDQGSISQSVIAPLFVVTSNTFGKQNNIMDLVSMRRARKKSRNLGAFPIKEGQEHLDKCIHQI